MNSDYKVPRVFIDTTVLCGAIRVNGLNRKLLELAQASFFYTLVISKVCLLEFYHNALSAGIGGVVYPIEIVDEFMDGFIYPVLENHNAVNTRVGRYSFESVWFYHRPTGEVLSQLTDRTIEETKTIIETAGMDEPLSKYDPNDMHVWLGAIEENCDYIVTSNEHRFPQKIGKIKRIRPTEFYSRLELE